MMSTLEELKLVACGAIDDCRVELHEVSSSIWSKPELCFQEVHAHDVCCNLLEKHGLQVEHHYKLDTAFQAVHGETDGTRPSILIIAEYDALPEIGHACGHNLIAEAALGAGLGMKAAMDAAGRKLGKLIILGTPAEEGGGGKIPLIDAGVFKDVTVAMMVHPWNGKTQVAIPGFLAFKQLSVSYKGKASHAAGAPWCGVNALDAVVMAYTNISCMRQQIKPTWRVHGVITNGGVKPNIIPEEASALYEFRAPTMVELMELEQKLTACFKGAATATGCQVVIEIPETENTYENVITNNTLGSLYDANASSLGVDICRDESEIIKPSASTDMGNVSHVVPSIHPLYGIPTQGFNHTRPFTEASGSDDAQEPTLQQAKALAMTGLDILWNLDLIPQIQEDFHQDLRQDAGKEAQN